MTDTSTPRHTATSDPTPTPSSPGHASPPATPDGPPAAPRTVASDPDRSARPAVPRTRTGSLWIGLIVAAVVFILLLVFILQNSHAVEINFLSMHGTLPLAVALLLATASGMLLIAIPGTGRILQLRHGLRRSTRRPRPGP